jgi:hypothetical protein
MYICLEGHLHPLYPCYYIDLPIVLAPQPFIEPTHIRSPQIISGRSSQEHSPTKPPSFKEKRDL